ncbi:MAG: HIRAN domain-containing protein [Bacillota bacterium]
MKDVIAQLYGDGNLMKYQGNELDLPFILAAIHLLRQGAMAAATRYLGVVNRWSKDAIGLIKASVPQDVLLNAAAEDWHGSFDGAHRDTLALLWGAVLGDCCSDIYDYYLKTAKFCTRVVGLGYEDRLHNLTYVSKGEPVALVWEPQNPHDPCAVKVVAPRGGALGYLRRTISKHVVRRMQQGEVFAGSIAAILGEEFSVNERLYLTVKSAVFEDSPEGE